MPITLLVSMFLAQAAPRAGVPDHVTVPLIVEGSRPYIDVTFRRADGSTRTARFLVDSGGGVILIEKLARDLGVTWGKTAREEGSEFGAAASPSSAFAGDLPLELTPGRVVVYPNQTLYLQPVPTR